MSNYGWNGSTLNFGGGVTPLTDLRQPNDPAEFDTTGSTDTTHLHGTGLPKNSFTASFLGSKCPIAGTVCPITSTIYGAGAGSVSKTYSQALITQMSVSGRKDGPIEGSFTAVPGANDLTVTTNDWSIGSDLGFNGSQFAFKGSQFTGLISANYTSSATPVEASGANDTDNLHTPGIANETLTIVCLGAPQCAAKAVGATVMNWQDGGTLGTSYGSYTAECVSTHPGGTLDGQTTTEYVFKMRRTGAGNS